MSGTSEGPAPAADLIRPAVTESKGEASPRTGVPDSTGFPDSHESHQSPGSLESLEALEGGRLGSAFSAAPLAMAVVDRDGLVVSANDSFGALLGKTGAALTGRVAAELMDLKSDARTWQAYREVLLGRQAKLSCTRRVKHPDGHVLWEIGRAHV